MLRHAHLPRCARLRALLPAPRLARRACGHAAPQETAFAPSGYLGSTLHQPHPTPGCSVSVLAILVAALCPAAQWYHGLYVVDAPRILLPGCAPRCTRARPFGLRQAVLVAGEPEGRWQLQ